MKIIQYEFYLVNNKTYFIESVFFFSKDGDRGDPRNMKTEILSALGQKHCCAGIKYSSQIIIFEYLSKALKIRNKMLNL